MAYFPITTCNLSLQAQNFIDLWSGISSHHRKRQRISLIPILRPKPSHSVITFSTFSEQSIWHHFPSTSIEVGNECV